MVAPGGMHGCSGGAYVVAPGGMRGCSWGACMVAPGGPCMVAQGGMHGCFQGDAWLLWGVCGCSRGACMVAPGGCAWLLWGGMDGIQRDTEIQSMSGRYTSYWNAFLLLYIFGEFRQFHEFGAVNCSLYELKYILVSFQR